MATNRVVNPASPSTYVLTGRFSGSATIGLVVYRTSSIRVLLPVALITKTLPGVGPGMNCDARAERHHGVATT